MSNPNHVMVLDPLNFGGLLKVPLPKTFETKGRNDWLKGILKKDLSLCCLFQRGKCHAGSKCHQVHADRNFVADMRAQNSHITSCCLRCGDTASSYPAGRAMFAELRSSGCNTINLHGSIYPLDILAYTVGIASYMASAPRPQVLMSNDSLMIAATRVCRLHLRGGCKYGKDCKNVHVCSQLGEAVLKVVNRALTYEESQPQHGHPHVQRIAIPATIEMHPPMQKRSPPPVYSAPPSPPPQPSSQPSTYSSAVPSPIPSADASFNQESLNIPVFHPNLNFTHGGRRLSGFGEDLNDEESIGPFEELAFELKITSEKKSNFLFRWSHPANASPLPTCGLASQSMLLLASI